MQPTVPLPTDNIYKFACLFGLTLIVVAVYSFITAYTFSLDAKVRYQQAIIQFEAKTDRTKAENDLLALNTRLAEITKSNESAANSVAAGAAAVGLVLSLWAGARWRNKIQSRDDRLAELQIQKLEVELASLRRAESEISRRSTVGISPVTELFTQPLPLQE